jgi:hypothetical protein
MKKIYSIAGNYFRTMAVLGLLAITANASAQNVTVSSQSKNCGNVIADFNQGTQGYTSKSVYDDASQSFFYNNRRGYWAEIGDDAHERNTASLVPRSVSILSTDYPSPVRAGFFDLGFVYVVPNPAVDEFKVTLIRLTTSAIPGGLDQTVDQVIAETLNPTTGDAYYKFTEFSSIAPTPYSDPYGNPLLTGQRGAICMRLQDADITTGPNIRYRVSISYRIASGGTFTVFDDFSLNNVEESPLPVNFITITAKKNVSSVDVKWAVADEIDVDHYEIEKSTNGRDFKTIGSVPSGKKNVYSFTDGQVTNGAVLYRVRNVDIDGRSKYSPIVRINLNTTIELKAFPSPATSQVTIEYPVLVSRGKFTLSTVDGRTVKTPDAVQGTTQTNINLSGLNPGMYIVRFDDGFGKTESLKVVKQ